MIPAWLLSPFAKVGGALVLVVALFVGTHLWLDARDKAAYQRGADAVGAQLKEAQARADGAARALEFTMGLTTTLVGERTQTQTGALTVKLDPLVKGLSREVQADPAARGTVSAGVLDNLKAQRAAVNASIAASDPGQPQPAGQTTR